MKKLATFLVLLSLGMFSFGCNAEPETPPATTPDIETTDEGAGSGDTDEGTTEEGTTEEAPTEGEGNN